MIKDDLNALAKRLYNVAHLFDEARFVIDASPWDQVGSITRESWRRLGLEVWRQMEWARRECPCECGHCGRGEGDSTLSVAPDDWKLPSDL